MVATAGIADWIPRAGDLFSQRVLGTEDRAGSPRRTVVRECGLGVLARRAWTEITAAPGEWLGLEARKAARILTPGDPTDLFSLALERRSYVPSLYALALPTLGLWLLAILGALRLRLRGLASAWPLLGLLGIHAAALMIFFVSTRLRLPLLFWLCPLAGVALAAGLDRWRAGGKVQVLAIAVLLAAIAIADVPLQRPDDREFLRLAAVLDAGPPGRIVGRPRTGARPRRPPTGCC